MLDPILAKIFGTQERARHQGDASDPRRNQRSRVGLKQLSDIELAAKTIEFKQRIENGQPLDDLLIESFAVGPRSRPPRPQHAPLRCPVDRRHGLASRPDRGNETGEGKTLVATLPALSERARRQRRSRRHRQRLPRQTRFRMDGPHLQVPRPHGRHHRARPR